MATATYDGEQITVEFSAQIDAGDYGPGTPRTEDIVDITIDRVTILGVECALKDLPMKLRMALSELADDLEFSA